MEYRRSSDNRSPTTVATNAHKAILTLRRPEDQAINRPQNRASFRSGEICVLDSNDAVEGAIAFSETDRKL